MSQFSICSLLASAWQLWKKKASFDKKGVFQLSLSNTAQSSSGKSAFIVTELQLFVHDKTAAGDAISVNVLTDECISAVLFLSVR